MTPFLRALPSLAPLLFALLAFVFSLLTITSHDWASRAQYADDTDSLSQFKPIYTLYRSPFQICTETRIADSIVPVANASSDGGDDPPPVAVKYTYTSHCHRYRAFGFNHTSCELATATNSNLVPQVGDRRLCEQIHYAGNYDIASTVFISLTFFLAIAMVFMAFFTLDPADKPAANGDGDEELAEGVSSGPTKENSHHGGRHHKHHSDTHAENSGTPNSSVHTHSPAAPYINLLVISFSIIGVATALISQFYGVLAFIQSAPNNADYATSTTNREHHDPWVQGTALSVYMTLSWSFGAAAGFGAWIIWSSPVVPKTV